MPLLNGKNIMQLFSNLLKMSVPEALIIYLSLTSPFHDAPISLILEGIEESFPELRTKQAYKFYT